jgi:hypothetical protein
MQRADRQIPSHLHAAIVKSEPTKPRVPTPLRMDPYASMNRYIDAHIAFFRSDNYKNDLLLE